MTGEPASTTTSSDAQLAWIERHARRVLFVGGLVAGNAILVALFAHVYDLGRIAAELEMGLAIAAFLLLNRVVGRMMRDTLRAARRESQLSRHMMHAVEQIGAEPAGVRGTVEALASTASEAEVEIYLLDAAERLLWSPHHGRNIELTGEQERRLRSAFSQRRAIRIRDVTGPACPLPAGLLDVSGTEAVVAAPMWSGRELHGIMLRRYPSVRAMHQSDGDAVVASLAALGAVAVGKASVVDREQQRLRDNELLLRSVYAATEVEQQGRLVEHLSQAAETVRADRGVLFALDAGRLRLACSIGIDRAAAAVSGSIRLRGALANAACGAGNASIELDTAQLDEASSIVLERLGFSGAFVVQGMHDAGGLLGLLVLEIRADDALDAGARTLLAAVARQATLSIERTRMLRSIRKRSRHLACTPKLARSLTGQQDPAAVARIAARELHEGFGFGRVSIALVDDLTDADVSTLRIVASSGSAPRTDAGRHDVTDALRECAATGRPYVSIAGDREDDGLDPRDTDAPTNCRGRIVVPISRRDRTIVGAIAIYEHDADLLGEDDLHMLETIADQLGGTIEQASLYASLERSYFETVEALSSALEAKDAYTLDHARSITEMSADVGRRLGMREQEIRDLKLGALLHDIGKIGVPSEILSKQGPLTDAEYEVMKEHTVIGEQIIANVEFLQGVRPLVLHEHERWDGAGYPHQLRGDEIPVGARIIFVCDSWHAMTSDRPYRKALPVAEAMRRLEEGAGSQFDPQVVAAFRDVMEQSGELSLAR